MVVMCHISHHRYRKDYEARPRDVPTVSAAVGPSRDPDLRVSQAERDVVAAALARHFADGRLTVEEYEERVEAALAARTGRDLEPLLADLPAADPRAPTRPADRRHQPRRPWTPHGVPSARVVAVAAVVVLAIATGWWALWLLWPALALTGGCGFGYGRRVARANFQARPTSDRPPVMQRL